MIVWPSPPGSAVLGRCVASCTFHPAAGGSPPSDPHPPPRHSTPPAAGRSASYRGWPETRANRGHSAYSVSSAQRAQDTRMRQLNGLSGWVFNTQSASLNQIPALSNIFVGVFVYFVNLGDVKTVLTTQEADVSGGLEAFWFNGDCFLSWNIYIDRNDLTEKRHFQVLLNPRPHHCKYKLWP